MWLCLVRGYVWSVAMFGLCLVCGYVWSGTSLISFVQQLYTMVQFQKGEFVEYRLEYNLPWQVGMYAGQYMTVTQV